MFQDSRWFKLYKNPKGQHHFLQFHHWEVRFQQWTRPSSLRWWTPRTANSEARLSHHWGPPGTLHQPRLPASGLGHPSARPRYRCQCAEEFPQCNCPITDIQIMEYTLASMAKSWAEAYKDLENSGRQPRGTVAWRPHILTGIRIAKGNPLSDCPPRQPFTQEGPEPFE